MKSRILEASGEIVIPQTHAGDLLRIATRGREMLGLRMATRGVLAGVISLSAVADVAIASGGGPVLQAPTTWVAGARTHGVAAGDLDGDGLADLATADYDARTLTVLRGDGEGYFCSRCTIGPLTGLGHPGSLIIADLNHDPFLDIAVASDVGADGGDQALVFLGNGSLCPPHTGSFPSGGSGTLYISTADLTGEGNLDLVLSNTGSGTITILPGDGLGGFTAPCATFSGVGVPHFTAIADMDGDGQLDIVVGDRGAGIVLFLAPGCILAQAIPVGVVGGPVSPAVGDFDGNGILDVAFACFDEDTIAVVRGLGARRFAIPTYNAVTTNNRPRNIAAADLNADGALDLVVANYNFTSISLLLGTGFGTFLPSVDLSTQPSCATSPIADNTVVAVDDFLADGLPDVAVSDPVQNQVSVFLSAPSVGLQCRQGNVDQGCACRPADTLLVNGQPGAPAQRQVMLAQTDPFDLFMTTPPSRTAASFVLYVQIGQPSGACWALPFGLGNTALQMPPSGAVCSAYRLIWNSIGSYRQLCAPSKPRFNRQAPVRIVILPGGIGRRVSFFAQGLIRDDCKAGQRYPFSVTNCVAVSVQ